MSPDNRRRKNLTRCSVFMREKKASNLQVLLHLFISPDNPCTCGSDLAAHNNNNNNKQRTAATPPTTPTPIPRMNFQCTIMNVGKTAAERLISGIWNVWKVILIRCRKKNKVGGRTTKRPFGCNNEISSSFYSPIHVFTHWSRRVPPFWMARTSRGLSVSLTVNPRSTCYLATRSSHSYPNWTGLGADNLECRVCLSNNVTTGTWSVLKMTDLVMQWWSDLSLRWGGWEYII